MAGRCEAKLSQRNAKTRKAGWLTLALDPASEMAEPGLCTKHTPLLALGSSSGDCLSRLLTQPSICNHLGCGPEHKSQRLNPRASRNPRQTELDTGTPRNSSRVDHKIETAFGTPHGFQAAIHALKL